MIFRILAALMVIALVLASFWLRGEPRETTSTTTVAAPNTEMGYSARQAVLIETGPDGVPMYTLNADVIRQHPGDGVDFEQVQMSFRDRNGQIWKGRADQGQLASDTGKVDLSGNVHVNGPLPGSSLLAELSTDRLSVDTHDNIISTAAPVTVESPGRQLRSKGLLADLNARRLVLESNVRGSFNP